MKLEEHKKLEQLLAQYDQLSNSECPLVRNFIVQSIKAAIMRHPDEWNIVVNLGVKYNISLDLDNVRILGEVLIAVSEEENQKFPYLRDAVKDSQLNAIALQKMGLFSIFS